MEFSFLVFVLACISVPLVVFIKMNAVKFLLFWFKAFEIKKIAFLVVLFNVFFYSSIIALKLYFDFSVFYFVLLFALVPFLIEWIFYLPFFWKAGLSVAESFEISALANALAFAFTLFFAFLIALFFFSFLLAVFLLIVLAVVFLLWLLLRR